MIVPRDYQQYEIVDPLVRYLCEHEGDPLVAAPTGVGKSLAINMFIRQSLGVDQELRFMIVTHSKEIIGQNAQGMLDYWPQAPVGCYSAGMGMYNTFSPIIYAGIQSVFRRPEEFGRIDALICDEAHTISDKETSMWQKFIAGLRKSNPDLRVTGFTATPYRLGMGTLIEGGIFSKLVVDLTTTERINRFVKDGYLCPLVSKKPCMEIDVTNVSIKGGEYDERELEAVSDKDELNRAVVDECIRYGHDRRAWLVFATGVRHATHLMERFRAKGITCEMLTGEATKEERTRLIGDKSQKIEGAFQKGQFRALVNVGVLTTGFDFPALDMIALARAMRSTGLYIQILGRLTRPFPGKPNGLVLDFGANIMTLGPFNAPILPKARRKGDPVEGEAPMKACAHCGTYCHTSVRICPECGNEFPISMRIDKMASTAKVMVESSLVPVFEDMDVSQVYYGTKDTRAGLSFRLTYGGFMSEVTEYWFPESPHDFQVSNFRKLWTAAGGRNPYPATAAEAVDRARNELLIPKKVQYKANTRHKEITNRYYAG